MRPLQRSCPMWEASTTRSLHLCGVLCPLLAGWKLSQRVDQIALGFQSSHFLGMMDGVGILTRGSFSSITRVPKALVPSRCRRGTTFTTGECLWGRSAPCTRRLFSQTWIKFLYTIRQTQFWLLNYLHISLFDFFFLAIKDLFRFE